MGLNADLLADNPELAMLKLQRDRTTKMVVAAVSVLALIVGAILLMTVAYKDRPGAAQEMQQNQAP